MILVLLLLIVLLSTCSPLRFTHSRCILYSSISPKTTSSYFSGTSKSRHVQSYPGFDKRAGLWMSKKFDEYRKKAQCILPESADSETTSSIAFHLMQSELENEKRLLELENVKKLLESKLENEKKLLESKLENEKKLLESKLENEKKLQKLDSDNELRQLTAFHSKQLSSVVQRQVVESFLTNVVNAYKSGTGPIFDAVDRLDKDEKKKFNTAATSMFPGMSAIDRAVRIPAMQAAVWEHFRFEQHVEYPVLSNDLLYGTLSAGVHIKLFKQVFVSDMADESYKEFLRAVGNYFCRKVVEYSEMDASTYEDEQE